ncbi:uncharacterized protein LOC113236324 isoform X1 [Hyposmocoma kahamanoa]|uniref:uncharacterized protein LOC113236324 isoform X1 n=1 Tax=Hyposmocoma kahamanoa TaxID=1477025 RepID=UPI000E6D863E|nr:uncharacterized protein LOC113236324 isoform X1 [Hyposmocoma kahamanoa]
MDAVFPAAASALCRGRRARKAAPRTRHRTAPVTFAEIKEVDEEIEEPEAASPGCAEERRRRPDLLDERLGRQFAEFRRRRAPRDVIREPPEESAGCDSAPAPAPRPPGAVGGPK